VNNPLVFIGLGGGRRCKIVIPWNLLLESITYTVYTEWAGKLSYSTLAMKGLELLSGYYFEVIVLGGFLVGILWGKWVGFPIWELG
jgi:hypothetical protein